MSVCRKSTMSEYHSLHHNTTTLTEKCRRLLLEIDKLKKRESILKSKLEELERDGCIGKNVVYDSMHNKLVKRRYKLVDMCVGTDSVKRDACVKTVHTPMHTPMRGFNYVVGTVFFIVLCILVEYA